MCQTTGERIDIPDTAPPQTPTRIDVTVKPDDPKRCRAAEDSNEIVVCAPDHGKDLRVHDDDKRVDDGIPRAPAFAAVPPCLASCIKVRFGKVPPPLYIIDLKAIPEAPKGSDAEKVANGVISDR